jgi:Domain of unknown function (DUF4259)
MGAWGPGPFENDTAMDWIGELRTSNDPGYPLDVLRKLDGVGPLATGAAETGIAAAEAVAASRGRAAAEVPTGLLEWLRASGARADAAAAELALRVVDEIEDDSELCALWDEAGGSRWHAEIADLRRRLRAQERAVSRPPRPTEVRYRPGDVAQLLTSAGKVAYIQLASRTEAPAFDLIRVMPGLFSPPLSEGSLAVLAGGETAFLSPGSFRAMATLKGFVTRGNFLVPGPCAGPQPLKHRPSESSESGVGSVSYQGERFSADEFARLHPDIDQTMLAAASTIPSPDNLLRQIECGWRPWMADDDDWMYPEETPEPAPMPQRPPPYPPTAQPGKFLLSS